MFFGNNPLIASHPANTAGKDFIVGDLHGCRDMLEASLAFVGFEPTRDRLFSTGDLVDRGPDSEATLELLDAPWFFPVLGNHDAMLLSWLSHLNTDKRRQGLYADAFRYNGGLDWARSEALLPWVPALRRMPFIRVVGEGTPARFQVLHAERLNPDSAVQLTDEMLDAGALPEVFEWVPGYDMHGDLCDRLLWGRSLRTVHPDELGALPKVSPTFVGHTITVPQSPAVLEWAGHHFLDFGAYLAAEGTPRFGLMLWDVQADSGVLQYGSGAFERVRKGALPKTSREFSDAS